MLKNSSLNINKWDQIHTQLVETQTWLNLSIPTPLKKKKKKGKKKEKKTKNVYSYG